jgi:hypothetical protein
LNASTERGHIGLLRFQVPTFTTFILREHHPHQKIVSRMEPSIADYSKFAAECRKLAQLAKTAEDRKILREMEAAWTRLVDETDGKSR